MRENDYVYCKDFKTKCWNWDKKKKVMKIGEESVTTYKLNKKELEEYLNSLKYKSIRRI